jgi:2',3'-cyclic-nucleotide 2'-phosphodiesterase (5'-nucleotidase family)
MKKLLLFITTLLLVFSLSACGEEVPTLESFNELEGIVADNNDALEGSINALEDSLDALETSLTALEGNSEAADALIEDLRDDITAINAELDGLDGSIEDLDAEIIAINALIVGLQASVDSLSSALGLVASDLDNLLNPPNILDTKVTEIVIAHTNDVHGRVNEDSYSGTMGMATIKNLVDALRATYENTFLVDAGDILHGTTFATLEEGESMINVMNQVGYDLMVPGNHDFNYGQDRLLELEELADFPMITANIQYELDDSDFMNPYVIQDFDGVKVGFFGLTSPETVFKTHPDNVVGLNFLDPIAQATLMVEELEPMVDVIILLAHIGLDANTEVTTADIANAVPGIDVIIDGHSHSTLPSGLMVGDTLIVSTGEYMKNLGVFSITVQGGEIVDHKVELFGPAEAEALGYGDDQEVQDYIDAIIEAQDIILDEVVGQTSVVLDGERADVRTGETNLGNIIADSMIAVTGADVAITNGGGIRASIGIGDVTLGDIITVLPFGNIIATKDLTGQQILDTLEYATGAYPLAEGMFPHVAGMTFVIDMSAEAGSRVTDLEIGGVPVDLEAVYSVATNDFLAAGGDGYELFATTPITGEYMGLHEALEAMFTVGVDIAMPTMGRITVINETTTE